MYLDPVMSAYLLVASCRRDPVLAKHGQSVQHRLWPGMERSQRLAEYSSVQACWCRLWVSSRLTDGRLERREVRRDSGPSTWGDRCEDDRVASHGGQDSRPAVGPR